MGPAWFVDPVLQHDLDTITNSSASLGNSVRLLPSGAASERRREENLADADVVLLKTYNFREDTTGQRMRQLLLSRVLAGKEVVIQYDFKGYHSKDATKIVENRAKGLARGRHVMPPAFLEMLKTAQAAGRGDFLTIIPTNAASANPVYGKDHEKYFITWKAGEAPKAIMGGTNIGDEWAFGGESRRPAALHGEAGFRDTDVELAGPVVGTIIDEFVQDAKVARDQLRSLEGAYDRVQHRRLERTKARIFGAEPSAENRRRAAGGAMVRFVANRPRLGGAGQYIEKLYLRLFESVPAGETITIANPFFLPTKRLIEGMKCAARRGVCFELIQNGVDAVESGFRVVALAARSLNRELMRELGEERIKVYLWDGQPELNVSSIHHKLARFGQDGPVLVGSSNLDSHSLIHNTEGCVLIADPKFQARFDDMLESDRSSGALRPLTLRELEHDSFSGKTKQWAVRRGFRYFL
ncbi:MAG: phosphatidylserine/phosphatidylglycerophosphate/cardiolipin synthase family protein [Deltaproteobacteria bacterium]|nr:phosphatidylserine/phosphatidylglycerophosphate/cardiolipin synthase family protein [Deltaproteobacteria bacterium]